MVVAAYPLAKVGLLLLKQLSKPVANFIKNEAKKHPQVRKYIIVPTGKAFMWAESKVVASVTGEKKAILEEEAIETGANALGEIILFGLLSIILLMEFNRQSDKKAIITQMKEEEVSNLQDLLLEVIDDVDKMKKQIREIELDLSSYSDALSLEELSHSQVHDFNFLDFMTGRRKSPEKSDIDVSSPSV